MRKALIEPESKAYRYSDSGSLSLLHFLFGYF
ncbi:hypothetical protein DFP81_10395 [Marinomonas pollencensis]|uniref:Uncharacterized protein n=1 Tax=Marinomonas pollencensis TaxID=491954 RepID=A0A3E0DPN2_9GAMM|nr:hypothetical protein DFP81_10395 [Marinomonas pollencensis]